MQGFFTPADIFWILITIAIVVTIVGFVFRKILKVALVIAALSIIASIGFGFIPEQAEKIKNGEATTSDVANDLGNHIEEKIEEGTQYIEDNKDAWAEGFV